MPKAIKGKNPFPVEFLLRTYTLCHFISPLFSFFPMSLQLEIEELFPPLFLPRIIVKTKLAIIPGVLVECDPSIKAIILKIDQDKHDYIVEDLDDQTLVIKESQLPRLKQRLEEASLVFFSIFFWFC